MVITRKVLRNVSLTAHPLGCRRHVEDQIAWVKNPKGSLYSPAPNRMPARVLVIGGSTGYGLSSRIVAAFGGGADTINVSFEREPGEKKTATPGWYNTKVFEEHARKSNLRAFSVFGDAFSDEVKEETADLIEKEFGQVDLIVYSLASPVRIDPKTGATYRSVLKPIGKPYSALSVNLDDPTITKETIEPATVEQTEETVKVMGGEDWKLWIDLLDRRNLLAEGAVTVAFSYIGPEVTYPVYREGTIGKAKEDLKKTAGVLSKTLKAYVSVNKALVTRASAVIPVVPLYMALLYAVMSEQGIHEQCTEQIWRLFTDRLYAGIPVPTDKEGRIRLDDWEMNPQVQAEVQKRWELQREGEPLKGGNLALVRQEYDRIHGFGYEEIDYEEDVDPRVV
ncbi:MAG: enoyl-ACP reductase FabV [Sphaerochaeta sp.]|jgi:enoyl-[acyl-carrier protein] reductase/trans-2-enoyl-CoA reductase (NAD+)